MVHGAGAACPEAVEGGADGTGFVVVLSGAGAVTLRAGSVRRVIPSRRLQHAEARSRPVMSGT